MILNKNRNFLLFLLYFGVTLLVYSPVLRSVIIGPDEQFIMPSLENFTSFAHYLEGLIKFETLDFQPVRDLSLSIDLFFLKHFDNSKDAGCGKWKGVLPAWAKEKKIITAGKLKIDTKNTLFYAN